MTTLYLRKSISRSPWRGGFLLIPLVLACFALLPRAQAATPELLTASPDAAVVGFNTRDGLNALISLTTGQFNTAIGFAALKKDNSGSHNTAAGGQALVNNTSGSFNTAIGENALVLNTTGSMNMALGQGALANNTTDGNTAMGFQALVDNTTGSSNVAVGFQALFFNTTGRGNTANGVEALDNNTTGGENTATGDLALASNTTGSGNTADGSIALFNNTIGNNNTATGFAALSFDDVGGNNTADGFEALGNASGSGNIALGFQAGFNVSGNNNIDIGNFGVGGEGGTIRIGSGLQTRTFIAGIRGRTTGVANAVPVLIDSNGQLGTTSSSRRFKKEIKPMDETSEAILGLKPVTFHYKSDSTGTPQFGLIAEEVAKVNPDLVIRDEKGEIYTVRYEAVNAMLLNEFLKEHRKVEEQNGKLENQACKIQDQETTITQLKRGMETVVARLKEQDSKIQKVSDQIELSKPARQTVLNNQ